MKKRHPLLTIILLCAVALPLMGASGCGSEDSKIGEQTKKDMQYTEDVAARMAKAVPPPALTTSNARVTLKKRAERWNTESKDGYIYLLDHGIVMGFYATKGLPQSLNSYLTTNDQIVTAKVGGSSQALTVEAPDIDGTYGKNADGIFFFTADTDAYVEWKGDYLFTDQPLRLVNQPLLVRQVTDK
jgi:hypothetical protein